MIDSHYIIKAVSDVYIPQTTYSPTAHEKNLLFWSKKKWLCINTFKTAISHTAWTFLW